TSTESEHFIAEVPPVPTVTEVPVEELPSVTAEAAVEVKDEDVAPTAIIPAEEVSADEERHIEEVSHAELAPPAEEPPTPSVVEELHDVEVVEVPNASSEEGSHTVEPTPVVEE
ncbi:hypothetical protein H0H93_006382, partial [Arthromyces matolae]